MHMVSVITGDIVNSREANAEEWLSPLKAFLAQCGQEPADWEIYRGDSFQLKTNPPEALCIALQIKSLIKQIKVLDVRMAIGIGEIDYAGDKITECNGSAFIRSGECFENLKKKTLAVQTPWKSFDRSANVMIELGLLTMDQWKPISSMVINKMLQKSRISQQDLAKQLGKSQASVSEALKRGGYEEIRKLLRYYEEETEKLC